MFFILERLISGERESLFGTHDIAGGEVVYSDLA